MQIGRIAFLAGLTVVTLIAAAPNESLSAPSARRLCLDNCDIELGKCEGVAIAAGARAGCLKQFRVCRKNCPARG